MKQHMLLYQQPDRDKLFEVVKFNQNMFSLFGQEQGYVKQA